MNPRLLAYTLLQKAEKNGQFSNIALDKALEAADLSDADAALASLRASGDDAYVIGKIVPAKDGERVVLL